MKGARSRQLLPTWAVRQFCGFKAGTVGVPKCSGHRMLSSPILLPAPASSGGPCQAICLTMGVVVTPEMTERPQEALFAEARGGVTFKVQISG